MVTGFRVCEGAAEAGHARPPQVHRVTVPQLRRILRSRQMMLPSVCTCYYALDELAERGLL
jgi:hypothetical protein